MKQWPVCFRVYNPPRTNNGSRGLRYGFWDVMIFRTGEELRSYIRSDNFPGGAYRRSKFTEGFCRALHKRLPSGKWGPSPNGRRGIVLLNRAFFGVGIVSHEWTHAAHYELSRHQKREPIRAKDDERLAWLQGELVRRFWVSYYRRFPR